MSRLRARCPDCKTLTAVAVGPEYQCHTCGREFAAGLVRVPRAWGSGGEAMREAAYHELPYPEAAVIEADSLAEQTLLLASELPDRPLVLGGCCCSHVGAIEALSAGEECLAVVWFDAHGDLNTPETSPSGNTWGMPLRIVIDNDAVEPGHVALVGARNLDPPEVDFIERSGIRMGSEGIAQALDGADAVYIAFDADVVEPGELAVFMPEPDGPRLPELEETLRRIAATTRVAGLGFTGLVPDEANEAKLVRLAQALGL
jgi:arginase